MSNDWDIRCVDCAENHGFQDMNHDEELMHALIRHAEVIAALHKLESEPHMHFELLAGRGRRVDTAFFKKHYGHLLRPVDEYGRLSGDCFERVACPSCGSSHPCKLPVDHAEPHR